MIAAATLCPGPPLLVAELSGADPAAAALRRACHEAVNGLVTMGLDLVIVVGAGDRTREWPPNARADLAAFGAPLSRPTLAAPLSVGLGAALLDLCGYKGPTRLQSVDAEASLSDCRAIAKGLRSTAGQVGLLVIADGSARRSLKAPGYFDARAEPYDESIHQAISSGDLGALHALDPELARELMAPGWVALQVLAAAFADDRPQTTVHYADAPLGVGYLVATMTRR